MRLGFPATHVQSHFTDDRLRHYHIDAINAGQIHSGLKNSPTGSKDLNHEVLATTLVIASTGAMLPVGHEAPCRLAALACRTESRTTHWQRSEL